MSAISLLIRFYQRDNFWGTLLMSGDNLLGAQPLNFYSEEMTETKWIALSHLEE